MTRSYIFFVLIVFFLHFCLMVPLPSDDETNGISWSDLVRIINIYLNLYFHFIIYFHLYFHGIEASAALTSATLHRMPSKFDGKWETECQITRFHLPTLVCGGDSVKLIFIFSIVCIKLALIGFTIGDKIIISVNIFIHIK